MSRPDTITEPMTMVTDYLLAVAAGWFGWQLWRSGRRMWAFAFFATAVASVLGGTYHGLAYEPLWKPTVYAAGLASLCLLAGLGRRFLIFGLIKFAIYAIWMTNHDDFKYVIYDYGTTLLVVAVAGLFRRSWWMVGSVAVAVVAAVVQQSELTIHQHFNHNDLYHIIQIVSLWMLRNSATDRSTTPPT
jgi:hypothetical protein